MLCLSENDLKNFISGVIRNVAKELKLQKWEQQSYYALVKQIKAENKAVSEKLEEFFHAYKQWHDFQVKLSQENNTGTLSAADNNKLQNHILARDAASEALLKELRK